MSNKASVAGQLQHLSSELEYLADQVEELDEVNADPFVLARILAGVDGETWALLDTDERYRYERLARAAIDHFDLSPVVEGALGRFEVAA